MHNRDETVQGSQSDVSLPHTKPSRFQRYKESFSKLLDGSKHNTINKELNRKSNLNVTFCEHTWDIDRISEFYKNSRINLRFPDKSRGLEEEKAKLLLEKNGMNELPKPKEISGLELFLKQFLNILWMVLLVCAILTFVGFLSDTSDKISLWVSIFLIVMIIIMCSITWYHERTALKTVKGFQKLVPERCTVIRDGSDKIIHATNVVIGDIIRIQSGDRIPADARILQCSQLKLETSSITGESEPIVCSAQNVTEDINIFDSKNIAFNSSLCVDGEGVAIVIRVGINSVIGQLAEHVLGQQGKKSRLEMQIKQFLRFLLVLSLIIGTIVFITGGIIHDWAHIPTLLAISYAIVAVAIFPEGLPITLTAIMMVIAERLQKKNVYLKKLDIVETLGAANIIATDKTGTLTKNLMTVTDVWYFNEFISGLPTHGECNTSNTTTKSLEQFDSPIRDILLSMAVCNKATYTANYEIQNKMPKIHFKTSNSFNLSGTFQRTLHKGVNPFKKLKISSNVSTLGTPSDVAMLNYVSQLIDVKFVRHKHKVVFEIPFNSNRKWQLFIVKMDKNQTTEASKYKLMMKGAPEILIKKCDKILNSNGDQVMINDKILESFQKSYEKFGEHGCRVIGFAQAEFYEHPEIEFSEKLANFPQDGLTFLGTCAIMDPPREETSVAIKKCKEAGIKVFMVTGDHHITAKAIAKQIGLIDDKSNGIMDWEIVHGETIPDLNESDWDKLFMMNTLVFSRTTPEQKLMIVEQSQQRNQIIAMTGDGVNDAPALKKSDIGVAMGSGSEIAKQSSDMILIDDNFASIVASIEEGRLMFDNIRKLMAYLLTHLIPELWGIIIYYCFGMPIGLTSLQILSIDLCTEIPPGVAMCAEPAEGDVMKRPPRKREKNVISKTMLLYCYTYISHIQAIACFLAYCCVFWSYNIKITDLWMSGTKGNWEIGGANFTSNDRTFSVEEQLYINRQASAAWQVGIVFGQVFHLFSTRSLRQSMLRHGFFTNKAAIISIIIEIFLLLLFVYFPGINGFLGGAPLPIECWIVVGTFGVFIFALNEIRKNWIRKEAHHKFVRLFKF